MAVVLYQSDNWYGSGVVPEEQLVWQWCCTRGTIGMEVVLYQRNNCLRVVVYQINNCYESDVVPEEQLL